MRTVVTVACNRVALSCVYRGAVCTTLLITLSNWLHYKGKHKIQLCKCF